VARKKHSGTERFRELLAVLKKEPSGDLRPGLQGYAYRFTLYLPLLAEGKPVFTGEQRDLLAVLFHTRFEGYSATAMEGSPPWFVATNNYQRTTNEAETPRPPRPQRIV